jgi:antitoxin (DNA-binding transcriptional repressor) of toxin-antitoxin stability system
MKTISVSSLKSHLSAELKKVQAGETMVVLDHRHPVARVVPFEGEPLFLREASGTYVCKALPPLTDIDPMRALGQEREERW